MSAVRRPTFRSPPTTSAVAALTSECRIAFALPAILEQQVRAAGFGSQLVPLASDAGDTPAPDVVMFDPLLGIGERDAVAARVSRLGAPCVFYTAHVPEALRAVVALQRLDPVRVLISGIDDSVGEIRAAVIDAALRGATGVLCRAMAPSLGELPPTLQFALDLAMRRPEQFFDAEDVARHAGFSRRHIDRVLHDRGLAPAKQWVIAARVWHALHLQRQRRMTSADTAAHLGYADAKALRRHRDSVLGPEVQSSASADGRNGALLRIRRSLTTAAPGEQAGYDN